MSGRLASIGWVLIGILVIAGIVFATSGQQTDTNPDSNSYLPSGTAALATLLSQRGYDVSVDRTASPKVEPDDVLIGFDVNRPDGVDNTWTHLEDGVEKNGGLLVSLSLAEDFEAASNRAATPVDVQYFNGEKRTLNVDSSDGSTGGDTEGAILSGKNGPLVQVTKSGKGKVLTYNDAIGLTNRFIAKGDNAKTFLELLSAYGGPHPHVVFAPATYTEAEKPGLLESIGSWVLGAWYQLLLLLFVIGWTQNKRFGLDQPFRVKQHGQRELVDAIASILSRSRSVESALLSSATHADSVLRSKLKLPMDASEGERDRLLPPPLSKALSEVRAAASIKKTREADALKLIQNLEREMDGYLSLGALPNRKRKAA